MTDEPLSFPRLRARTQRFTLGDPRSFSVSTDGSRVAFLRSSSGTDRAHALWVLDVPTGQERLVADPAALLSAGEELTAAERARRERSRETGGGIVGYSTDSAGRVAAFALSSRLWLADLAAGGARELPSAEGVIDPRVSPDGRYVAYASAGTLRLADVETGEDRELAAPETPTQVWGLAEFVAGEEMGRYRGIWWAPEGGSLLAERYDEAQVPIWYISDPANPDRPPAQVRYPAAGTTNADVTLWHVQLDGSRREIGWDHTAYEYLNEVTWRSGGDPVVQVQSRDQRTIVLLRADLAAAGDTVPTSTLRELHDDAWLELVPGTPSQLSDGRLVGTVEDADTRRLTIAGVAVTPPGLQVRGVLDTDDGVLFAATQEPTEQHVFRLSAAGELLRLSTEPGVHTARSGGGTTVVVSRTMDTPGARAVVRTADGTETALASHAVAPPFAPSVTMLRAGAHEVRTALLLPRGHVPGSAKLPVLMDPYGGPHGQRVLASSATFLEPQWFADQGFAVVVADGRGTPARGTTWERAVAGDFATLVLQDQISALSAAASECADLDLSRVGIRGWSFGGYLAALAVLRRPDVFHAGIAGAPVTDMRLYDTHYTERYLGHPDERPEAYAISSLLDDAPGLERPLLIVHGLADDNVVAAHTLRLSSALLAAGKPHEVLPLSGVTHMTPQEAVAENLLLLQVDFLRRALHIG